MKLQELAKNAFTKFANNSNMTCNWNYLSKERKLVWMKEILDLNKLLIDNIKLDIRAVPEYKVGMSGLEAGVNEGRRKERMQLKQQLDDYYNSMVEEFNRFNDTISSKRK
jgi:hypothetical protein